MHFIFFICFICFARSLALAPVIQLNDPFQVVYLLRALLSVRSVVRCLIVFIMYLAPAPSTHIFREEVGKGGRGDIFRYVCVYETVRLFVRARYRFVSNILCVAE